MQCLSLQRICPDAKARQRLLRLYGEGFQIAGLEHATKVPRCEWFLCVLKVDLSVIPQSHLIRSFDVDGCLKVNCIKAPFHVVSPHHFVSPHLSAVPIPVSPTYCQLRRWRPALSHSMQNTWRPAGAPCHLFHQKPLGNQVIWCHRCPCFPLLHWRSVGTLVFNASMFPISRVWCKLGNQSSWGKASNHTLELHPSQSTSEASLFVYLKLGRGYRIVSIRVERIFNGFNTSSRGYAVKVKSINCPLLAKRHPGPRLWPLRGTRNPWLDSTQGRSKGMAV